MRPINEESILIKIYLTVASGLAAVIIFCYFFGGII